MLEDNDYGYDDKNEAISFLIWTHILLILLIIIS
jgi:hypothetical protein